MRPGVRYIGDDTYEFTVWAPLVRSMAVKIVTVPERLVPMKRTESGYWMAALNALPAGTRYLYRLDNDRDRPDPASHFQPDGVHGPSQVVDHGAFPWMDGEWKGLPLPSMVMYEIHTGTFTPEGTFEAIIPRLAALKALGINVVELMPVAQFPGTRNWGYDGVYPYAVQNSYGGPEGLKRLVNACHTTEMAVILDVVYNHLGPEGNYLWDFGPYFTDKYRTPWGQAINFDGPCSDEVRNYFIGNALHWVREYHLDALRIDAIHGIFDFSAKHILQELGEAVHLEAAALGRSVFVIPESDLNDVKAVNPIEIGGYGLDAQWNDDFHHAVHALITGELKGYYEDFGRVEQMEKALREGFVYSGQYSSFRKRKHGNDSKDRPAHQFVVFSQNHDQVGNRMLGDRISKLASFEALKLAAGLVILSPSLPLLFMGEEYGEDVPFLYFVSHGDKDLIDAVRNGRRGEFKAFSWEGEPPDPQSEGTFRASKLDWGKRERGHHHLLLGFYEQLIRLRRNMPALSGLDRNRLEVSVVPDAKNIVTMRRWDGSNASHVYGLFNFEKSNVNITVPLPAGLWTKVIDSSDSAWAGPGSLLPGRMQNKDRVTMRGQSVALYVREGD
jgi:maltooligosyltrehalose trehalohydrolase